MAIKTAGRVNSNQKEQSQVSSPHGSTSSFQGKLKLSSLIWIVYTHTDTQLHHIEYISLDIVELLDEAKTMTTIGYHEHIVNLQGLSIVEGGTNLVSEVN